MYDANPPHLSELRLFLETHLDDPTAVAAGLAALLGDPDSYGRRKDAPGFALRDFVHELVLTDPGLRLYLSDPDIPVRRELCGARWAILWHDAPAPDTAGAHRYDVCISFAGIDRSIAERIAIALRSGEMQRRVFYDEFEKTRLWGQELFDYLHTVYSRDSRFCVILFSHAYRKRAWTRHELRAAQTRLLTERESYILPVALDEGAVPEPFAQIGYWAFSPGDEEQIAEATEQKINDWMGANYLSLDEMAEAIHALRISNAILHGFRRGIGLALEEGQPGSAEALRALALVSAAKIELLAPHVRALVEWVVFTDGPVADLFRAGDEFVLFDDARVGRTLGRQDLLRYSRSWEPYIKEILGDEHDEQPSANIKCS